MEIFAKLFSFRNLLNAHLHSFGLSLICAILFVLLKWLKGKNPEGRNVTVIDLSSEDDCLHEMFVEVEYDDDPFSAKLEDIEPIDVDETTKTVIDDWKYWVARGYEF